MTAKGFSSRCLRRRSLSAISGSSQRQARWMPPRPLTATIFPGHQSLAGKLDRVAGDAVSVRVQIEDLRPADRAAVRLRVVAAVFDVVVFPVAVRAHGEGAHGGLRPVVGDVLDDGKARAAVGAVDEGVAIAPVPGVQQLPQAVVTDADIRGNERVALRLRLAA